MKHKGSTTKPIVRLLRVQTRVKQDAKLFIEIHKKVTETVLAGIEETAGQRSITNFWAVIIIINSNNEWLPE